MSKSITLSQEEIMPLWRCYLALTKPKVVALMLLTAVVGMCLSNPDVFLVEKALLGLLGIGLMAGAAASLNHLIDERIDRIMERTHKRPLPSGRLQGKHVIIFALALGLTGDTQMIELEISNCGWQKRTRYLKQDDNFQRSRL